MEDGKLTDDQREDLSILLDDFCSEAMEIFEGLLDLTKSIEQTEIETVYDVEVLYGRVDDLLSALNSWVPDSMNELRDFLESIIRNIDTILEDS